MPMIGNRAKDTMLVFTWTVHSLLDIYVNQFLHMHVCYINLYIHVNCSQNNLKIIFNSSMIQTAHKTGNPSCVKYNRVYYVTDVANHTCHYDEITNAHVSNDITKLIKGLECTVIKSVHCK